MRTDQLRQLGERIYDVLVVGGGINGAVSAAALSARGLSVALIDRGDFASFTSQQSSNLVWGGFKYLENYELPLVWNLCSSRNRLMDAYPTQINQVGFLATLDKSAPFPAALAGLGAFGYWGIGRFATKVPRYLSARGIAKAEPVVKTETAKGGIEYYDGYLPDNDARFVWNFVRTARDLGATTLNYVELQSATHDAGGWTATVCDVAPTLDGEASVPRKVRARTIVNAAGPFVDGLNDQWKVETDHRIVYSKGIHLIVPRLTESERVLAFFDDTGRLFYVIPMADRSVIGTTDTRTELAGEGVTEDDRSFLLNQINARLNLEAPLAKADIIAERCGVRPLVVKNEPNGAATDHTETDWTSLSRKHELEVDKERNVVSLFGGKLTDCLNMGEEVVEAVESLGLALGPENDDWFGEPPLADRAKFYERAATLGLDRRPTVERAQTMAEVLWRRHGSAGSRVLDLIEQDLALGSEVVANSDVLIAEVRIMADDEMIVQPEDFLRRRTKLALTLGLDNESAEAAVLLNELGLQPSA